jgi:glutamate--cysteine ligase
LSLSDRLALLRKPNQLNMLCNIVRGIEKESLRVTSSGHIANTAHPKALGSALKHPSITTDYSEALLEFITAPSCSIDEVLKELDQIHRYSYRQIGDELLWVSSMPCQLGADSEIPVAQYGTSNIGTMKQVYRIGLGHRYGRAMQTISGIHYNFSVPDTLWQELQKHSKNNHQSLQDFKSEGYFATIRNFRRYSWLLLYLLGAAPAVCRSFVANRKHRLQPVGADDHSLHSPYATSLRMGDLGYQSNAQSSLVISYNSLQQYITTLRDALEKPYAAYDRIGLKDKQGEYRQLNTHLLQIENEFYSAIRPKRTTEPNETPLQALDRRGVEYIEVRCLDVNPLLSCGIDAETIRFLDTFLLFCLLSDSPQTNDIENAQMPDNMLRTVYAGRDPEILLMRDQTECKLQDWGAELLDKMQPVAEILDRAHGNKESKDYQRALYKMQTAINDQQLTPSAVLLEEMKQQNETFYAMSMRKAREQREDFLARELDDSTHQKFIALAQQSFEQQRELENNESLSFDEYLSNYWQSSRS